MPEDSTRRLLRVFGIAVTECEDALSALTAALGEAGAGGPSAPVALLDAYDHSARELRARWSEVSRLVLDYHGRAQEAVTAYVRAL